jgi:hypothetical protein
VAGDNWTIDGDTEMAGGIATASPFARPAATDAVDISFSQCAQARCSVGALGGSPMRITFFAVTSASFSAGSSGCERLAANTWMADAEVTAIDATEPPSLGGTIDRASACEP